MKFLKKYWKQLTAAIALVAVVVVAAVLSGGNAFQGSVMMMSQIKSPLAPTLNLKQIAPAPLATKDQCDNLQLNLTPNNAANMRSLSSAPLTISISGFKNGCEKYVKYDVDFRQGDLPAGQTCSNPGRAGAVFGLAYQPALGKFQEDNSDAPTDFLKYNSDFSALTVNLNKPWRIINREGLTVDPITAYCVNGTMKIYAYTIAADGHTENILGIINPYITVQPY